MVILGMRLLLVVVLPVLRRIWALMCEVVLHRRRLCEQSLLVDAADASMRFAHVDYAINDVLQCCRDCRRDPKTEQSYEVNLPPKLCGKVQTTTDRPESGGAASIHFTRLFFALLIICLINIYMQHGFMHL